MVRKFTNCVRCGAETKRGARFCEQCTERMMDEWQCDRLPTECIVCGKHLSNRQGVFCGHKCEEYLLESFKKYVMERFEWKVKAKPFDNVKTKDVDLETARKKSMTYGEYMAQKYIKEHGGKRQ